MPDASTTSDVIALCHSLGFAAATNFAVSEGPLGGFTLSYRRDVDGYLYGAFAAVAGTTEDGTIQATDVVMRNYRLATSFTLHVEEDHVEYAFSVADDAAGVGVMVSRLEDRTPTHVSFYRCQDLPFEDE